MDEKLELASPWAIYAGRVKALFERDPKVRVEYDNDAPELKLYVDGAVKAEAIGALLPSEVGFGNVSMPIDVVPSNDGGDAAGMFRAAFEGNPALVDVMEGCGPCGDVSYALFAPEVVQLKEDDISEFCGVTTMTYAKLASLVLDAGGVLVSSALKL